MIPDNQQFDVILTAAGMGTRLGAAIPKAFIPLAGKPLFLHALNRFDQHPGAAKIIVVAPQEMIETAQRLCSEAGMRLPYTIVPGGCERWQSVRNGVMSGISAWVMVHDAARPFVSAPVINSLLDRRDKFRCVITATPEVDTVRRFEGDCCVATLDRSTILRVGTPQLFHRETLVQAFAKAESLTPPPTDEAALIEACGIPIGFAWGDPQNFKVTTPADLVMAEALCAARG
jgi:2-C-methyl-D-erythritol 4-phosphate cytidylyltransferase